MKGYNKNKACVFTKEGEIKPFSPANGKTVTSAEVNTLVGKDFELIHIPKLKSFLIQDSTRPFANRIFNEKATELFAKNYPVKNYAIYGDVMFCPESMLIIQIH